MPPVDDYSPPEGSKVGLDFSGGPYTPPEGSKVGLEFAASDDTTPREDQYLFPATLGDTSGLGGASLRLAYRFITAFGMPATAVAGASQVYLYTRYINHSTRGINAALYGRPTLRNWNFQAYPPGFVATSYGTPLTYNLRQYLRPSGFSPALYGLAFVQGGVKELKPSGLAAPSMTHKPTVINTTANKTVLPTGFNMLAMGAPWVDPRSLRPFGFVASGYGTGRVQLPPRAVGFDALRMGVPGIRDKNTYAGVAGFADWGFGYPVVKDPRIYVQHIASPNSAVFGDVALRLTTTFLYPSGFASSAVSPWGAVVARNRYLLAQGFRGDALGAAAEVRNATPSFAPVGFAASHYGNAVVSYYQRTIPLAGIPVPFQQLPVPVVTKTPSFAPVGFVASVVPGPMVAYRVRLLLPPGLVASAYGQQQLTLKLRQIAHEGRGIVASLYGAPRIEHGNRLLLGSGFNASRYGTAHWISLGRRTLAPSGIPIPASTRPMVGGTRYLLPEGFSATRWGSRIIPEIQTAYPLGFSNQYGLALVYNHAQMALPLGFTTYQQPAHHWGLARVFNSDQYIMQYPIVGSGLEAPDWSQTWTGIANRNRMAPMQGFVASRFGTAHAFNNARPMIPPGIQPPANPIGYRPGLVAYRIRSLLLEGLEPPHLSTWGVVYNKAFPLRPAGYVASLFGNPSLLNMNREINRIGNFRSDSYGTPFIADAVRELSIERRYSIEPPRIELPYVGLYSRYLEPEGIDSARIGLASLSIFFRIITPRWTYITRIGSPALRNLTPELGMRGYNMELFGETHIRLQWRPVYPDGSLTELFGRARIADRRQHVSLSGTNYLRIGDKLVVTKTGIPPLATQRIWLYEPADMSVESNDEEVKGRNFGIGVPVKQVSEGINVNARYLIQRESVDGMRFGSAKVTANSIRTGVGYHNYAAVASPRVELSRRTITVNNTDKNQNTEGMMIQPAGWPRLSPHTIYATTESTQQARTNHPLPYNYSLHVVDGRRRHGGTYHPDILWGMPRVQNQNRAIAAASVPWIHSAVVMFPRPTVINKRTVLRLTGFNSMRVGRVAIPGDLTVEMYIPFVATLWGRPVLERGAYYGPRTYSINGIPTPGFGTTRVEFLNRELHATGSLMERLGTRRTNDSPYMWQGLRVGPLMPTIPIGFVSERMGDLMIDFRVRELRTEGYEAFTEGYLPETFGERMRVRRTEQAPPDWQRLFADGPDVAGLGVPGVLPGVHFIRPDGNSDQFRKGAW